MEQQAEVVNFSQLNTLLRAIDKELATSNLRRYILGPNCTDEERRLGMHQLTLLIGLDRNLKWLEELVDEVPERKNAKHAKQTATAVKSMMYATDEQIAKVNELFGDDVYYVRMRPVNLVADREGATVADGCGALIGWSEVYEGRCQLGKEIFQNGVEKEEQCMAEFTGEPGASTIVKAAHKNLASVSTSRMNKCTQLMEKFEALEAKFRTKAAEGIELRDVCNEFNHRMKACEARVDGDPGH